MAVTVFLGLLGVAAAFFVYQTFLRERWIRNRKFPTDWEAILHQNQAVYPRLSSDQQSRLQQLIHLFLADKTFYGCAGLVITDEMRVTIAAEACLLVLNHDGAVYPGLRFILVYPSAFRAHREQHQGDGTVSEEGYDLLGESWSNGKVILSWDDVTHGVKDFDDGHNVVLHEFAHQLDGLSGSTNGAPPLRSNSYKSWARVFGDNFADLQQRSAHNLPTLINKYGATNPAEFFAVVTETFFEQPRELQERRPELFEELCRYYRLDPREWHRGSPPS